MRGVEQGAVSRRRGPNDVPSRCNLVESWLLRGCPNDGRRIVYNEVVDDGLFIARIDGSQRRRLTNPSIVDDNPAWSTDDQWIVLHRGDTTSEIYVVRVDGSQETRVTSLGNACCPDWKARAG